MRQARMTGVLAGLLFAVAAGNAVPAGAAEIRVLSAGAVETAVVNLAKDFERDTGHTVRFALFLAFLQTPSSRAKFKQVGLDYTE